MSAPVSLRAGERAPTPRSIAVDLGIAVTLLALATAGGRITASDEYTMYRLTESLVTRGAVWVEAGNAEPGPDGRLYPKAGLGQAIAAAPFHVVGRLVAAPFSPARRDLVTRAVTSLLNPVVLGVLAAVLFLLFHAVGASPRGAFFWSVATCFATPLWVYGKSFLTEPLLALGLAAGLYGALRFRETGEPRHAFVAGLAWGFAVLVKYAVAPAVLLLALPFAGQLKRRTAWPALAAVAACALVAVAYNVARTGSPLGTGYGRQATTAAFTTPLFVGLYGLLVSSGKGVLWFAPLVVLVPPAVGAAVRRLGRPALGLVAACAGLTLVYASFEHWAGDGSWGPRYLVPLLPLAIVLVVAAEAQEPWRGRGRQLLVGGLAALGLLVQLGGVGIYFGAQMREAGDYPYTRALDDPSFMVDSHFNPAKTPIAGHWRMLARNASAHLRGEWPRITPRAGDGGDAGAPTGGVSTVEAARLALPASQVDALTRGLDFWWAYAAYAGLPWLPLLAVAALLFAAAGLAFARAWRAVRALEVRPLTPVPDAWVA